MKNDLLFSISCLLFATISNAQTNQFFKPVKVDLGMGIGIQSSNPAGFLFFAEPTYSFAGNYKAGIRLEQAILNMKTIGSYALTFDYYLSKRQTFRPFVGSGYSYFNTTESGGCDPGPGTVNTVSSTKKYGAIIRTGFEFYHFRLSLEYNFVPSTYVSALDAEGKPTGTVSYKNSYAAIKGSVSIGGGRKKILTKQ